MKKFLSLLLALAMIDSPFSIFQLYIYTHSIIRYFILIYQLRNCIIIFIYSK